MRSRLGFALAKRSEDEVRFRVCARVVGLLPFWCLLLALHDVQFMNPDIQRKPLLILDSDVTARRLDADEPSAMAYWCVS